MKVPDLVSTQVGGFEVVELFEDGIFFLDRNRELRSVQDGGGTHTKTHTHTQFTGCFPKTISFKKVNVQKTNNKA